MPCRCIRGPMVTRNLMCVSSACEASGRKVLWCDIYAITPERSLSSAQSAIEALLSTELLIGICALKVSVMNREQNKTERKQVFAAVFTCDLHQEAARRKIPASRRVR